MTVFEKVADFVLPSLLVTVQVALHSVGLRPGLFAFILKPLFPLPVMMHSERHLLSHCRCRNEQ
jgi:hypothetical protein